MKESLYEFTIAGLAIMTTNDSNQMQHDISNLWERFITENIRDKIIHKISNKIYALYTDYVSDFTKPYRFILGCAVSNSSQQDKGLFIKTVPQLTYEVFNVTGQYPQALINAWQNVWSGNLKRAYIADFELYPEDFDPVTKTNLDLYISVSK